MTGRVVSVANLKGGVGKTTTVAMLAEGLAAGGESVLVIDMDAGASTSVCLAGNDALVDLIVRGRTLDAYLKHRLAAGGEADPAAFVRRRASRVVVGTEPVDLSLLPCSPALRTVERLAVRALSAEGYAGAEKAVHALFEEDLRGRLAGLYDWVIIDCPPGLSLFAEAAVSCSDAVIVATVPEYLSTFGLSAFVDTLWGRDPSETAMPPPRSRPLVLATRVQAGETHHRETLEDLRAAAALEGARFGMFETVVPKAAQLASALEPPAGPVGYKSKYGRALREEVVGPLLKELKEVAHGA